MNAFDLSDRARTKTPARASAWEVVAISSFLTVEQQLQSLTQTGHHSARDRAGHWAPQAVGQGEGHSLACTWQTFMVNRLVPGTMLATGDTGMNGTHCSSSLLLPTTSRLLRTRLPPSLASGPAMQHGRLGSGLSAPHLMSACNSPLNPGQRHHSLVSSEAVMEDMGIWDNLAQPALLTAGTVPGTGALALKDRSEGAHAPGWGWQGKAAPTLPGPIHTWLSQ